MSSKGMSESCLSKWDTMDSATSDAWCWMSFWSISPKTSFKISKMIAQTWGDGTKHIWNMSTVVNNFSQLETMVSITSFENPCDIVPLLSNSETLVCTWRLVFISNIAGRRHSLSWSVTTLTGPVWFLTAGGWSKTGRGSAWGEMQLSKIFENNNLSISRSKQSVLNKVMNIWKSYMWTADRAFLKLLGNFLATSGISSNFLHSEQFL